MKPNDVSVELIQERHIRSYHDAVGFGGEGRQIPRANASATSVRSRGPVQGEYQKPKCPLCGSRLRKSGWMVLHSAQQTGSVRPLRIPRHGLYKGVPGERDWAISPQSRSPEGKGCRPRESGAGSIPQQHERHSTLREGKLRERRKKGKGCQARQRVFGSSPNGSLPGRLQRRRLMMCVHVVCSRVGADAGTST